MYAVKPLWSRPHTVPKLIPDGHTNMSLRQLIREFLLHAKYFAKTQNWCRCRRNTTGFIRWVTVRQCFTMFLDVFTITSELRTVWDRYYDHPQIWTVLIVCPSGINFGTVWGHLYRPLAQIDHSPISIILFGSQTHAHTQYHCNDILNPLIRPLP